MNGARSPPLNEDNYVQGDEWLHRFRRMRKQLLSLAVVLVAMIALGAQAENFGGDWEMNGNGWTSILRTQQQGNSISGQMLPS
jgi:hypothetical protein